MLLRVMIMANGKRLNLEDIARKAGVSRSTVSRVINNDPHVNVTTRARVLTIIEQEKFSPNMVARSMVTRRTQVIGVVIPHELHVVFTDPYYFPTLLKGVAIEVNNRDYAMLLWLRQSGEDEDIFYRRILQNGLMDGLLIASATVDDDLIAHLIDVQIPFVMVERPTQFAAQISYVTVDNLKATHEVMVHLFEHGYRRIGLVAGSMNNIDARERLDAYKEASETAGLAVDPALIVMGDYNRITSRQVTAQLIEQKVDAVFACNDVMAHGVYEALAEAGLSIPDDVAVVGFDDLRTATYLKPQLTTVRQPIEQKGSIATNILLDMLDHKKREPQHIVLPTELIIRESCGCH